MLLAPEELGRISKAPLTPNPADLTLHSAQKLSQAQLCLYLNLMMVMVDLSRKRGSAADLWKENKNMREQVSGLSPLDHTHGFKWQSFVAVFCF